VIGDDLGPDHQATTPGVPFAAHSIVQFVMKQFLRRCRAFESERYGGRASFRRSPSGSIGHIYASNRLGERNLRGTPASHVIDAPIGLTSQTISMIRR
jgi:hypothetical protein